METAGFPCGNDNHFILKKLLSAADKIGFGAGMPSYMSETVATRRDKGDNTLCAECGSPHNLKLCSGMPPLPPLPSIAASREKYIYRNA